MAGVLVAGLLLAHGLIHAAYLSPRPLARAGGPAWPFELEQSWLLGRLGVPGSPARMIGAALVVATIAGFALAGVAALGVGADALWTAGIGIGAVASLATLVLYFHPWLSLGIVIDLALLWAVFTAGWAPEGLAAS